MCKTGAREAHHSKPCEQYYVGFKGKRNVVNGEALDYGIERVSQKRRVDNMEVDADFLSR